MENKRESPVSVAHELDMGGEYNLPAPVRLIKTDENLEWHYGHLSPQEIVESNLEMRQKARVAQLQMLAVREVVGVGSEYRDWLLVYGHAIGPSDNS